MVTVMVMVMVMVKVTIGNSPGKQYGVRAESCVHCLCNSKSLIAMQTGLQCCHAPSVN